MQPANEKIIRKACLRANNDKARMLDILHEVQDQLQCIDSEAMELIAELIGSYRVEVEGVVTFYAFFSQEPKGAITIRLCDDIIDRHEGFKDLVETAEEFLGIQLGQTTEDGRFSLDSTPCIGMCDQAPAALINYQVFTRLTPSKFRTLLRKLRTESDATKLVTRYGDGNNSHHLIRSMVNNYIRQTDKVLLGKIPKEAGLENALSLAPAAVRAILRDAGLRGRGGAGFPTGKKWEFAAQTAATRRYIICNADEGEPGTFKDRVLLTERAHLLFEGMTIAAHAVGAEHGILYLRAEYRYLHRYLEDILKRRRKRGLLGSNILGKDFHFDIRIQLGAGAYICGEESSLISSCEGRRGEPKNRPPFPVQAGYFGFPTVVNNVETLCCVPRILAEGSRWFCGFGTQQSTGTKLLSVCGDCTQPGTYEVEFGTPLVDVLQNAGSKQASAVNIGGASGQMINRDEFKRRICFEDLPTAGAVITFASHRNILDITSYYMDFFIEESCGYCTPCRVGNVFMQQALDKIRNGLGEPSDLDYLKELGKTIIATSRCGLGHTSPNPVLSTMANFPLVYAAMVKANGVGLQAGFNIQDALDEARIIAKRRSLIYDPAYETGGK